MNKTIKIIILGISEGVFAVMILAVILFSSNAYHKCNRIINFSYNGKTSFGHVVYDEDNVYPPNTEFNVESIYRDGKLTVSLDTGKTLSRKFSISETQNSEELSAVLKGKIDAEEKEFRAEDMKDLWICVIAFLIVSVFFIFSNFRLRNNTKGQIILLIVMAFVGLGSSYLLNGYMSKARAPIIYLYPEEKMEVNVCLALNGDLTSSYPDYDHEKGWIITAYPDGTLIDKNGRKYTYLFWEGNLAIKPDLSHGFCVKGEETANFLEHALKQLGLSDKEANAFIMYWLPQMEGNKYNVITFQTIAYEKAASLKITPEPDTIIRVNMLWYPSNTNVNINPQELSSINPSTRKGFTVVEWGGERYKRGIFQILFQ